MCLVWMSCQLELCGTAGLSALASARALSVWDSQTVPAPGFVALDASCVLGVVQAWHRRNGWEVLGLQQWEGTVGAE